MKRLIIIVAGIALLAGTGAEAAQKKSRRGFSGSPGPFIQRNVSQAPLYRAPPANADLRYGPQPDYPQSPPGGAP
jgi:hypothetical protein